MALYVHTIPAIGYSWAEVELHLPWLAVDFAKASPNLWRCCRDGVTLCCWFFFYLFFCCWDQQKESRESSLACCLRTPSLSNNVTHSRRWCSVHSHVIEEVLCLNCIFKCSCPQMVIEIKKRHKNPKFWYKMQRIKLNYRACESNCRPLDLNVLIKVLKWQYS